jgi:hypothetical protein
VTVPRCVICGAAAAPGDSRCPACIAAADRVSAERPKKTKWRPNP